VLAKFEQHEQIFIFNDISKTYRRFPVIGLVIDFCQPHLQRQKYVLLFSPPSPKPSPSGYYCCQQLNIAIFAPRLDI